MKQESGLSLKIVISEHDRYEHKPLYEWLIEKAHEHHLASAQAIRGMMGYNLNSTIHSTHILSLSEDLPLIVEMIDTTEKIEAFIPLIEEAVKGGIITCREIQIQCRKVKS